MKRILAFVLSLIFLFIPFSTAYAQEQNQTVKILAIGNSFTQNSVSQLRNFSDGDISAKADLLVASLTIGGSSLKTHATNIKENAAKYTYAKYYTQNEKKENISIQDALSFEEWDYIVLQQVSQLSGMADTYEPYLKEIIQYIRGIAPNVKIVLNQTWAYETDSKHSGYSNYNNSQSEMFIKLKSAYLEYANKYALDIIPCGEAFQLARSTAPFDYINGGLSLCNSDGYHANTAGCYLLSAVWYEYFTNKSVWDNVYTTNKLTKNQMYALKQAAHNTIKKYYTVQGSNDDTFGFLTEAVSSSKTQTSSYLTTATSTSTTTTTSAVSSSSKVTTTSNATSVLSTWSQISSNEQILSSAESEILTVVPMPKQNYLSVIIITVVVSVIAVAGAVVLVVYLTSKKKK